LKLFESTLFIIITKFSKYSTYDFNSMPQSLAWLLKILLKTCRMELFNMKTPMTKYCDSN